MDLWEEHIILTLCWHVNGENSLQVIMEVFTHDPCLKESLYNSSDEFEMDAFKFSSLNTFDFAESNHPADFRNERFHYD